MNPFSRALDRATGARPIPGNLVRHMAISSDALDAMLEMIASAQRTVHFENYIIHDDDTGRRFAAAWALRARAGVRVRVLYDAFGCLGTGSRYWRELRNNGVDVRPFRIGVPVLVFGLLVVAAGGYAGRAVDWAFGSLLGATGETILGAFAVAAGALLVSGASLGALLRDQVAGHIENAESGHQRRAR